MKVPQTLCELCETDQGAPAKYPKNLMLTSAMVKVKHQLNVHVFISLKEHHYQGVI